MTEEKADQLEPLSHDLPTVLDLKFIPADTPPDRIVAFEPRATHYSARQIDIEILAYDRGLDAGWVLVQQGKTAKNPEAPGTPEHRAWSQGFADGEHDAEKEIVKV